MFRQISIQSRVAIRPLSVASKPMLTRYLSTTMTAMNATNDHRIHNPDAEDIRDQREFDANKKKLENLEHGGHRGIKKPSVKDLQRKGVEAPIEQNRPDDGVY